MLKKQQMIMIVALIMGLALVLGGCGGSKVERAHGLEPDAVVKTAFDAAKSQKLALAAAYVAPDTLTDTASVASLLSGYGVDDIKKTNLLSVKQVASQGNFAVVVATVHQENTLKVSIRTIGLEKIDGDWYIIPTNNILQDAKYRVLVQLLSNI